MTDLIDEWCNEYNVPHNISCEFAPLKNLLGITDFSYKGKDRTARIRIKDIFETHRFACESV